MITATAIVCADTPGMDQVLEQHRIAFVRATRPFTPVGLGSDHDIAGHRHG
jgi:hypothetical protein